MGKPNTLCVTRRSMMRVLVASLMVFCSYVSRSAPEMKP